jgi:hypothetical protein
MVLAITLLAIGVGSVGCDESLPSITGPTPDLVPTFDSIQSEIFENGDSSGRVACTSCHNAIGSVFNGSGLNLTNAVAYANLVGVASRNKPGAVRVIAGDAENSYLIHKLEGRAGIVGARMPLTPPSLTDGQILVIRRWIELGARND